MVMTARLTPISAISTPSCSLSHATSTGIDTRKPGAGLTIPPQDHLHLVPDIGPQRPVDEDPAVGVESEPTHVAIADIDDGLGPADHQPAEVETDVDTRQLVAAGAEQEGVVAVPDRRPPAVD
jgi:hypothetical protein